MYKEIAQIKSFEEIKLVLSKKSDNEYFTRKEIKSVERKNKIKSLGARYLIKKSILDFLELNNAFHDLEVENEKSGKPTVYFTGKVKNCINKRKIGNIHISISHSRNFVATLVIIE